MKSSDRIALDAWKFILFFLIPSIVGAFLLLAICSQSFRESIFGPDYYTRSTPAYHGQHSRWHW